MKYFSIAVDGPSASGKSSICKVLAKRLNINHLSSGSLYRAISLYLINNNIKDTEVEKYLNKINIEVKFVNFLQKIYLNSVDVTEKLETNEISMLSSKISPINCVREYVKNIQRSLTKTQNIIIDGRDITSVVLKDAKYKFFLTASVEVRAKRRYLQYGKTIPLQKIIDDIKLRDERDYSRKISPLIKTPDSIEIDCSNLNLEQTVEEMLKYIEEYKGI